MKITVITVNYNNSIGLERTIRSVVNQTEINKEFIVIDGASNDGSVDILQRYSNQITKWVSEPDTGIYNAMNKGVRMATGDYCIFMNSGDTFYSNKVLSNAQKFLRTKKDVYNGNALYVINNGNSISWYRKGNRDSSVLYFYKTSICHQASFIKTSSIKKYMYDESLRLVADWKFWMVAIGLNNASYERINLDVCCFEEGGATTTQHERGVKERKKVLEELFSSEEIARMDEKTNRKSLLKYFYEGSCKWFWLLYARIFMKKRVSKVYGE